MKRKKQNSLDANLIATFAVVALIVAMAFLMQQNKNAEFGNSDALGMALQSAEAREFVSTNPAHSTAVRKINAEELQRLAVTQPVIYGNLSASEAFEVRLESKTNGLLIIVREKGVEKVFAIRNVELRGS